MPFRIAIASLTTAPQTLKHALPMTWVAERMGGMFEAVSKTLQAEAVASKHADVVDVKGHVHARVAADCSRCAERVEMPVDAEFEHHFVGPGQLDAGDVEGELALDGDPDVSEHDGAAIDLEELCVEHAILALPDVPLCDEDCLGLCPQCGINRNRETCQCDLTRDPASPWAKLAELRLQKN